MVKWNTMHDIKVQLKIPGGGGGGNGPVGPPAGALVCTPMSPKPKNDE